MAASPKSTFTPPPEAPIPDDDHLAASLQLPLSASVVLSSLPRDAQAALAKVDDLEGKKGMHLPSTQKDACAHTNLSSSNYSLSTHRLRPSTSPTGLQDQRLQSFRDRGQFSEEKARGGEDRKRLLLHQQCVCTRLR